MQGSFSSDLFDNSQGFWRVFFQNKYLPVTETLKSNLLKSQIHLVIDILDKCQNSFYSS